MCGVHTVIEDEFGGGEMSNPIVMLSVNEESKVLLSPPGLCAQDTVENGM